MPKPFKLNELIRVGKRATIFNSDDLAAVLLALTAVLCGANANFVTRGKAVVHFLKSSLKLVVKRLPFAARFRLGPREAGRAVRILFYPLDIIYFTAFSKFRMLTKRSGFY